MSSLPPACEMSSRFCWYDLFCGSFHAFFLFFIFINMCYQQHRSCFVHFVTCLHALFSAMNTHRHRHAASSSHLTLTRSCQIHTYQRQWTLGWLEEEIEFAVTGSCWGLWELDINLCSPKTICTPTAFNSVSFPLDPSRFI